MVLPGNSIPIKAGLAHSPIVCAYRAHH